MAPGDNYLAAKHSFYGTPYEVRDTLARLISGENPDGSDYSPPIFSKLNKATYVNVKDFGAIGDGTTNDTAAVQAAVASATPSPLMTGKASIVFFPAGTYLTDPIVLPQRVGLKGSGPKSTTLKLRRQGIAQFGSFISNALDYSGVNDSQGCMVSDMRLNGDKFNIVQSGVGIWNGTNGYWHDAIVFKNDTPSSSGLGYEYVDGRHYVSNVHIEFFRGNGLTLTGRGCSEVSGVQVWGCDGFAYNVGIDSYLVNCDCGDTGIDGFLVQGNSSISNSKAWFSGSKLVVSRSNGGTGSQPTVQSPPSSSGMTWNGSNQTAPITFSLANGFGNGFNWTNIGGTVITGSNAGGVYVGVSAQDNARAGFRVNGQKHTIIFEADSNNNNGTQDGTKTGTPIGSYAGIEVLAPNNNIRGMSWDRAANVNQQAAALRVFNAPTGNQIDITFTGTINDGTNMPLLTNDSDASKNSITLGVARAAPRVAGTTSGALSVDPFQAEVVFVPSMTGAMSVSAPALSGTNGSGVFLIPGMRLSFHFTQDATGGRLITWDPIYDVGNFRPDIKANKTSSIHFVYTGSKWLITGWNTRQPTTGVRPQRVAVSEWIGAESSGGTTGSGLAIPNTLGQETFLPIDVAEDTTCDALGVRFTAVGAGTALVVRMGIYNDDGTGIKPSTLLYDCGTVDATTVSVVADTVFSISGGAKVIPAGRYWLSITLQGTAVTTAPQVVSIAAPVQQLGYANLSNVSHRTWCRNGSTGALVDVSTTTNVPFRTGTNPHLGLRRSA